MKRMTILAAALAVAASTTPPARAEGTASVSVPTHDLDLASPAGQRILRLRIARAASTLCDVASERLDARVRTAQSRCRAEAIAGARTRAGTDLRLAVR